jgi:mono/diheme cytochrome c family protein
MEPAKEAGLYVEHRVPFLAPGTVMWAHALIPCQYTVESNQVVVLKCGNQEGWGSQMKNPVTAVLAGLLVLFCVVVAFSLDAAADHGKQVYAEQKCSMCHSIGGVGGKMAPLDHVGFKLKADQIKKWIKTPKEMKPNVPMRSYADLSENDLDDLAAYLLTLK